MDWFWSLLHELPVPASLSPAGPVQYRPGIVSCLKASEYTPNTAEVMGRMIAEFFPPEYITLFGGGRAANQALLSQEWDYIFFNRKPSRWQGSDGSGAKKSYARFTRTGRQKPPASLTAMPTSEVAASRIVWAIHQCRANLHCT